MQRLETGISQDYKSNTVIMSEIVDKHLDVKGIKMPLPYRHVLLKMIRYQNFRKCPISFKRLTEFSKNTHLSISKPLYYFLIHQIVERIVVGDDVIYSVNHIAERTPCKG